MNKNSYKHAENRREDWFMIGMALAVMCIPTAVIAVLLAAWKSLLIIVAVLLGARQMMAPGVRQDGLGFGVRPWLKLLLRALRLRRPQ